MMEHDQVDAGETIYREDYVLNDPAELGDLIETTVNGVVDALEGIPACPVTRVEVSIRVIKMES